MPEVVYIKTPDGVIIRFAERAALEKWLVAGRIPVGADAGKGGVPDALWLDSDNTWKPLPDLLQKLGIRLPTDSSALPEPFPGVDDEFFRKSFGPGADGGQTSAPAPAPLPEPAPESAPAPAAVPAATSPRPAETEPRRSTTAPMAAFDVRRDEPASRGAVVDDVAIQVTERLPGDAIPADSVESPAAQSAGALPADEGDEVEVVPAGIMFETSPASVSQVISVRRKKAGPVAPRESAHRPGDDDVPRTRRPGTARKILIVVGVLVLVAVAAVLTEPYWYPDQAGKTPAVTEPGTVPPTPPTAPAPVTVPEPAPVPAIPPAPAPEPAPAPAPAAVQPSQVQPAPAAVPAPVEVAVPVAKTAPVSKAAPVANTAPVVKPAPVSKTEPVTKPVADEPYVDEPVAPNNFEGHMKAGDKALSRDPEVALAHYEMAHQLKPGSPVPLQKMGEASYRLKRYEAARGSYEGAIAINPSYGPALIGLARVAKARGNTDEAKRNYQSYLDVNPNGTQAAEARQYLENQ